MLCPQPPKKLDETLDIESMLEAALEREAKKLEKPTDTVDHVSFDVPLLIRVLEHAREGVKSDVDLHKFVENILAIRDKGVLTMDDYEAIAGGSIEGTDKESLPPVFVGQQQDECVEDADDSINSLKLLAGLR